MRQEKPSLLHTLEEGQRVHYLANLGGLVAIAGLEHIEPNLLMGALCSMKNQLQKLPEERISALKNLGDEKLLSRSAEKRSFKTWQRAQQTERFDLTQLQMKKLIVYFGGKIPALDKDIPSEFRRLLRGICADDS